jgi:hypothetical protein
MKTWERTRPAPLFDLLAGLEAKEAGKDQAAENKASLLAHARKIALRLGKGGQEVTADDVARELHREEISIFALGNAAGALFKGKEWKWTGEFRRSERAHANGNLLRIWKLK